MRRLLIALLAAGLLITSCSSKIWEGGYGPFGLCGKQIDSQWTVTLHYDYDGDGDIDTVIWHYTLYENGDLEVWEEVIG